MVTVKVRGISINLHQKEIKQFSLIIIIFISVLTSAKKAGMYHPKTRPKVESNFQSKKQQRKHYEFIAGLFHLLCGSLTQMGMKGKYIKCIREGYT